MLRRIARISAPMTLIASVTLTWLFAGCGTDVTIAEMHDAAVPPPFVDPDAGTVTVPEGLTEYCPSSECPAGHTTCPGSRFPCEVNLKTDPNNCGECGNVCPARGQNETYACVDGRCAMACDVGWGAMDCDGVPDNGCETRPGPDNCGACGKTCPDPANPCVFTTGRWRCGCTGNDLLCPVGSDFECVDGRMDDRNCGACGNVCDSFGNGAPLSDNTYYGCVNEECGSLKCVGGFANCDNNMSNGCETSLVDDANCGACGNACPSNAKCRVDELFRPFCACPGEQTFCPIMCFGSDCMGECFDVTAHPYNCGGCGIVCATPAYSDPICNYGRCSYVCKGGRADCNGNPEDGCEVNTQSDPRNCGGCGIACDAVAGQACVAGQCVVEPCDSPDGGVTAR
jgi:hypothetical protein